MRLFFKIIISRQTKCDNDDDNDLFLNNDVFITHIQQNVYVYAVSQSVEDKKQIYDELLVDP